MESKNSETFKTWNDIALLYQEKFMDLDLYNETYDFICKSVTKEKATLLEIGCGPGNITRYLLSKRPDFNILGIDIAPNMIELARQNVPAARFEVMDCRHINQLNSKFDAIIGGFCLPYLNSAEADELIAVASDLLNEHGLLYLSFVEGDPASSEFKTGGGGRVFFNYHVLEELQAKLAQHQFGDFTIFKVPYKTSDNTFDIHTILTAVKKG